LDGSIPMAKIMVAIVEETNGKRHMSGEGELGFQLDQDHGHVLLDDKKGRTSFTLDIHCIWRAIGYGRSSMAWKKRIREMLITPHN